MLPLAGNPLDRAAHRRADAAWVAAAARAETTRIHPVWRTKHLIRETKTGAEAAFLDFRGITDATAADTLCFLGLHGEMPVFSADLSAWDDPPTPPGTRYDDLRRLAPLLAPEDASLLAHARGMVFWRARYRFCGVCGAACTSEQAGHVMRCTGCGATHFPRTDPAVIMLVTHEGRALLGQPSRFRNWKVMTTLAGFVEPGETLEEAVARETWEEAGVRVRNIRYFGSQPWPFPSSVMLGFFAEAENESLTVDGAELLDARWFTRDEARHEDGFSLPPPFSIARHLIDAWLDG